MTLFVLYYSHLTCKQFRSVSQTMEKKPTPNLTTDCKNLKKNFVHKVAGIEHISKFVHIFLSNMLKNYVSDY